MRGGGSRCSIGIRHDLPQLNNTNWGIDFRREFYNDYTVWDIDKIEQYPKDFSYYSWIETQA